MYWQQEPYHRRKLFFKERGVLRLQVRAHRVFRPGSPSSSQQAFIDRMDATVYVLGKEDRPGRVPVGRHQLAINRRVRDEAAQAVREYLQHGGCAVPNCPCMTHRVGLPTLAKLVAVGYFAAHSENRDR